MRGSGTGRGGAAVGVLDDLGPTEMAAVLYLRLWCDGAQAQQRVWNDFAGALGAGHGRTALNSLESLCRLCADHGRRPLMRHGVKCRCLGADEACFANFVAAAADGDTEDAMLLATLLVRADIAPCLLDAARSLGLALRRLAIAEAGGQPRQQTLH
ncbi:hypothetical protein QO034_14110 [Sedimentitalea sp. JM2-8]|uniref:Uncharacterized protein n=1 Tax=Sedimentitalea xiamensis TaxID=3050037 RepID=A0ABT7FHI7_9RHOB|nr:hypothetical protein [Sedimentitalea xiamensis]MDK3074249.1 hypothetical protein [Sedimentitalea xiamensis]